MLPQRGGCSAEHGAWSTDARLPLTRAGTQSHGRAGCHGTDTAADSARGLVTRRVRTMIRGHCAAARLSILLATTPLTTGTQIV